jgi:hypothetical protein
MSELQVRATAKEEIVEEVVAPLDETAILKAYEALIAEDGRWVNLAPRL